MFDIKAIDLVLHIKEMKELSDKLFRDAANMKLEAKIVKRQAQLLEKEFEDNLKDHNK